MTYPPEIEPETGMPYRDRSYYCGPDAIEPREPTPQTDENVSPRTEAGRRLFDYAGAAVKLTKPEAQRKMARLIRADILAIEREASSPALDVELLRQAIDTALVNSETWEYPESIAAIASTEYARLQNSEPDR